VNALEVTPGSWDELLDTDGVIYRAEVGLPAGDAKDESDTLVEVES